MQFLFIFVFSFKQVTIFNVRLSIGLNHLDFVQWCY